MAASPPRYETMELLAPVGSKESFITAIRAGADAIYIGVPGFNARISASSISLYDLQVLTKHAHEKEVKVFLALNTLIKHEEISDVVKSIAAINRLSPDAVIIQDLGVAGIIRKYFPDMQLHASTQLAVHNRMGVDILAQQGFKRAILARELSFAELKIIANASPIPIEVFCHGALCFCLSGMCLFSSFIGGLSGNRGMCTQPCRRRWQNGKNGGYIFSPRDLELAEHIGKLKSIGIASLKIEGRMRSSEYVYRTVKAYRLLIDAPEKDFSQALKEARVILSGDAARKKTTCLFSGRDNELFQPQSAQCLGNLIGKIDSVGGGSISVDVNDADGMIAVGDRLRLSNPASDTTITFKVKEFTKEGSKYVIAFGKAGEFKCGDPVFKTVDAALDQRNLQEEIDAVYENHAGLNRSGKKTEEKTFQGYTALISNKWKELKNMPPGGETDDALWVRFDDIQWLNVLPKPEKNSRYVFYLTKDNLRFADNIPERALPHIAVELPPFIGQRELQIFKQSIDKMTARGIRKWVINNVSHFGFFTDCEITAGQFLYTWNAYTAAFLSDMGARYFTASWEDDFLNIRKMCGPGLGRQMVVYLYGYIPVVRSRIVTREMLSDDAVGDLAGAPEKHAHGTYVPFSPVFESGMALLIPDKPINLFTARRKLKECGINNFGIDLSFMKPDNKAWNAVASAYKLQENIPGTLKFNFKRGVK